MQQNAGISVNARFPGIFAAEREPKTLDVGRLKDTGGVSGYKKAVAARKPLAAAQNQPLYSLSNCAADSCHERRPLWDAARERQERLPFFKIEKSALLLRMCKYWIFPNNHNNEQFR